MCELCLARALAADGCWQRRSAAHALQVTSCLIQAGDGICSKPDRKVAIQENLSCVFGLVSEAEFVVCLKEKLFGAIQVGDGVEER